MQLIKALRYVRPASVAFVGAGGKTTALFRVAKELSAQRGEKDIKKAVLVTTSTHLGAWQTNLADQWSVITSRADLSGLQEDVQNGILLLTGEQIKDRLSGLSMELLEEVHRFAENHNLPLLIEADGADMHPLKAPAKHEPAIPKFVETVVVVAGLEGLGKPLMGKWVHRAEVFARVGRIKSNEPVSVEALVRVLLSKRGGLKNIPEQARKIVLLNQADTVELQTKARILSENLISGYDAAIVASLQPAQTTTAQETENRIGTDDETHAVIQRIAGIILAAGSSSRFGQPKQLLSWKGEPFVRHVARTALNAGLQPVVVVIGSHGSEIEPVLNDLPLRIANNAAWMDGMSSSIRAGLQALPDNTGAAVFLQADQPQIPVGLIKGLIELHQKGLYPIIAPRINKQRGNPVLFDTEIIPELLNLEGDVGGRALFQLHPPKWLEWHDGNLLLDIDSPEDYQEFLLLYPESEVN